jgi:tRNA (cmo5U34)-methyltransferase
VVLARDVSPNTDFFLADPSEGMLTLARARHADLPDGRFFLVPSEDLPRVEPFEVITAVQCHHYLSPAARERAVRKCHSLLVRGGVLVVFENVRSETERGQELQRSRWAAWLRSKGRSEQAVMAHAAREGTQYFPLRPSEHVALLQRAGFSTVETIWRAYGQAGFLAISET